VSKLVVQGRPLRDQTVYPMPWDVLSSTQQSGFQVEPAVNHQAFLDAYRSQPSYTSGKQLLCEGLCVSSTCIRYHGTPKPYFLTNMHAIRRVEDPPALLMQHLVSSLANASSAIERQKSA
jgi:hypothetical protein